MEELLNRGKTKTSPGFPASVNTEFSSKKTEFPLEWKRILTLMFFLGIQLFKLKN